MAEWVNAVENQTYSWKYKCTACGKIALYNHGYNNRNGKGERPKCGYKFCPNCGRRMRNAEERNG